MSLNYYEKPSPVLLENMETGKQEKALAGKVAIVTGGGKGIGKGISLRMAEAGAAVVIVGNNNMAMAEETCREIEARGGVALCIGADLGYPEGCRKVVDFTVEKLGHIDILVNNAAYQPNRDILEYTGELFDRVISVNLLSYLRMTVACLPWLKKSGNGRIINIESVHAEKATGFDVGYATSKGGVSMLTRETAVTYRQYGITCNAILPGGTMIEFKTEDKNLRAMQNFGSHMVKPRKPGKKFVRGYREGLPSDSANMAVFLASEAGEHYNGVEIRADGGMVLF